MEDLKQEILQLIHRYYKEKFEGEQSLISGKDFLPPSGKVFFKEDLANLVESSLDFWLTTGRFNDEFEKKLTDFIGCKKSLTTNSGSSANLLALSALTSPLLGEERLKPGDEVLTVAAGFPTTVNPILQNNLVPVFVDVKLPYYNIDIDLIERAIGPKTKAIMLAHTLGNPFDLEAITKLSKKHNLWLVEDCCDALGSTYQGKNLGTFGDLGTLSFYPAHHITMGEGGAVLMNRPKLNKIVESFRDWGRDCWCPPGKDNSCNKRFNWDLGDLPSGYDHKYIYSHVGYNLKITDMQAAVGCTQMNSLESFIEKRKRNYDSLREALGHLEEYLILPQATPNSDPSWFGFPLTIRDGKHFSRSKFQQHLQANKVGSRLIFAGNIIRQPYFKDQNYRLVGSLDNTDKIMSDSLWVGVFPKLSTDNIQYMAKVMESFFKKN